MTEMGGLIQTALETERLHTCFMACDEGFLTVQLLRKMRVYCDTRCKPSASGLPDPVVVHRLMRINRTSRRVPPPLRDGNIYFGLCSIRVGLTVQDIALRTSEWAIGFNSTRKNAFRKGKARF